MQLWLLLRAVRDPELHSPLTSGGLLGSPLALAAPLHAVLAVCLSEFCSSKDFSDAASLLIKPQLTYKYSHRILATIDFYVLFTFKLRSFLASYKENDPTSIFSTGNFHYTS